MRVADSESLFARLARRITGGRHPPQPAKARPATQEPEEPAYSIGFAQLLGERENQEDFYAISNWRDAAEVERHGIFAAVADGMGGLEGGERVSSALLYAMCARFPQHEEGDTLAQRLLEMAAAGQRAVLEREDAGGGSTLVSVLIQGGKLALLSIGDSRIALYRAGALLPLNREHVLYRRQQEQQAALGERVDRSRASPRAGALTSYIGKARLELIDRTLEPMTLLPGDKVLLMSDGVFNCLSDGELLALLDAAPDAAAEAVARAIEDKRVPGQDNATIIIIGRNERCGNSTEFED